MLDPRFPAAIGRCPYAPDDPRLNLSGTVGPGTLWPDATLEPGRCSSDFDITDPLGLAG